MVVWRPRGPPPVAGLGESGGRVRAVSRIQRDEQGRHEVVLTDGTLVRVRRSGKKRLDDCLEP